MLSKDPFSKCFLYFTLTGSWGSITLAVLPCGGNKPWHTSGMWPWLHWLQPAELGPAPSQQLSRCPHLPSMLRSHQQGKNAGKQPSRVSEGFCNPRSYYLLWDTRYAAVCSNSPVAQLPGCSSDRDRDIYAFITALAGGWGWHKPLPVGWMPHEQMKSSTAMPRIWLTSSQEQQHRGRQHHTCKFSVPMCLAEDFQLSLAAGGPHGQRSMFVSLQARSRLSRKI